MLSFAVSMVCPGPGDPFTLAECVRDRPETSAVASRVDQARLDRLLAEHDPYEIDA